MNPGQQMFYQFILDRVADEHKDSAEALLQECFKQQEEGTFDLYSINDFALKIKGMAKPEYVSEILKITENFKGNYPAQ